MTTPIRVLIADDNRPTAFIFAKVLEARGYETRVALNGLAALDFVKEFSPHVMLLDIGMPAMDGYAVIRSIRSEPESASLPIVVISGRDRPSDKAEAIEAGANHYLVKPIDFDELWTILAKSANSDAPG